jgi:hypothetical protein
MATFSWDKPRVIPDGLQALVHGQALVKLDPLAGAFRSKAGERAFGLGQA